MKIPDQGQDIAVVETHIFKNESPYIEKLHREKARKYLNTIFALSRKGGPVVCFIFKVWEQTIDHIVIQQGGIKM